MDKPVFQLVEKYVKLSTKLNRLYIANYALEYEDRNIAARIEQVQAEMIKVKDELVSYGGLGKLE